MKVFVKISVQCSAVFNSRQVLSEVMCMWLFSFFPTCLGSLKNHCHQVDYYSASTVLAHCWSFKDKSLRFFFSICELFSHLEWWFQICECMHTPVFAPLPSPISWKLEHCQLICCIRSFRNMESTQSWVLLILWENPNIVKGPREMPLPPWFFIRKKNTWLCKPILPYS